MPESQSPDQREYGLILQQAGKPQQVLVKFVMLLLNYRYGLDIIVADNMVEAFSIVQKNKERIRCTVVIQNKRFDTTKQLCWLSLDDTIPLFLLLPAPLLPVQKETCQRMKNVAFCAWETAFSQKKIPCTKPSTRSFPNTASAISFRKWNSIPTPN